MQYAAAQAFIVPLRDADTPQMRLQHGGHVPRMRFMVAVLLLKMQWAQLHSFGPQYF
jgi:hypothetical protein